MRKVKIKKLNDNAKIPTRGSKYAAGYDLYAATDHDIIILPQSVVKIGTGLAMAFPENTFGAIYARSGLSIKKGLRPSNCVGIVDADYRGEVIVALYNDTDQIKTIENGDRIAQLVLQSFSPMDFEETDNLDETDRGDNGFGSTGNK